MASRSDIQAGKAHVTLYVQSSQLVKGLQAANQRLMQFGFGAVKVGAAVAAAGAAAMGAIGAAVGEFTKVGSELDDMAARTGLTVEALSELGYAAQQSGTDLATLEKAVRNMQRTTGGNGQPPEEQFLALAESIAAIDDPSERAQAALKAFGKSGADLLPMLAEGRQGIEALRREADRLGARKSGESATMAAKLGDAIDRAFTAASAAIYDVGAALGPVLLPLVDSITEIVAGVAKWVKGNGDLVRAAAGAAAAAVGVGLAIAGVGAAIVGVTAALSFVMTPLGAFTVGIAAAGAAAWKLFGQTEVVQGALREAGAGFEEFADVAKRSWKAAVGAVMSGDLQAALDIAVASANLAWVKMVDLLKGVWEPIRTWFESLWTEASDGAAMVMIDAWYGVQRVVVDILGGIAKMFYNVVGAIARQIEDLLALAGDLPGAETLKDAAGWLRQNNERGAAMVDNVAGGFRAGIEERRAGAQDVLRQQHAERMAAIEAASKERRAASGGAVDMARGRLDELLRQAEYAREIAPTGQPKKRQQGEEEQRIQSAAVATTASALVALGGARTPENLQREANKKLDKLVEVNEALLKQARAAQLQFTA